MTEYRLSDADRDKLGLKEEWLSMKLDSLSIKEAEQLEAAGYDTDEFFADLDGYTVYDGQGNPVMVDSKDADGNPILDDDGKPVKVPKIRLPIKAQRATIWLAARRAGSPVNYDDFDFDIVGLQLRSDGPGKDPE